MPNKVQQDMHILSKFWADDEEDQSGDDPQPEDVSQHHDKAEPNHTPSAEVLSKSQKKR